MTKILVVDDSMVSRLMIKQIVNDSFPDWLVIDAANGDDALAATEENQDIDIALLDYNMPGMNGLELAEKIQSTHPIPRMALLTANIQDHVKAQAESLGLSFINKPIQEDVVVPFLQAQ
ncbi:MAG: response regulator [Moraxellaceae bacterium]|nr:MAG: response regulator [Moraxellaceae bacterium]